MHLLDGYGFVISVTSLTSFLHQGAPGIGVVGAVAAFSSMSIFHTYARRAVDLDGKYL